MFASAYGLTFDQFLTYTPKQIQIISEVLRARNHNEDARRAELAGFKADYVDLETDRMMKDIDRKHQASAKSKNHDTVIKETLDKEKDA